MPCGLVSWVTPILFLTLGIWVGYHDQVKCPWNFSCFLLSSSYWTSGLCSALAFWFTLCGLVSWVTPIFFYPWVSWEGLSRSCILLGCQRGNLSTVTWFLMGYVKLIRMIVTVSSFFKECEHCSYFSNNFFKALFLFVYMLITFPWSPVWRSFANTLDKHLKVCFETPIPVYNTKE